MLYVYEPVAATNLVANPSVETNTSGWAAFGSGASISQVYSQAAFGICSLAVATGASTNRGASYTTAANTISADTVYVVSVYAKSDAASAGMTLNLTISWYTGIPAHISDSGPTAVVLTTNWQRVELTATAPSASNYLVLEATSTTANKTFYLDGAQVETGIVATSYADGDQPGCTWSGVSHASASTRSGQYRAGGLLRNVDSYLGIKTVVLSGLGSMPYDQLDRQYSTMPGNVMDGYRQRARDVTIIVVLKSATLTNYHATRKLLSGLFLPNRVYPPNQPIRLRYTGASSTIEFDAYYVSGLEGQIQGGTGNYEKIAIQVRAIDPFLYGVDGYQQILTASAAINSAFNSFVTNASGTWATLGTVSPTTAKINTMVQYSDGWIIGGSFDNLGGYATADNIAKISNAGSVTALAGGSANGEIFKIIDTYDLNNRWLVCGAFTTMGGTAMQGVAWLDKTTFQFAPVTHGANQGVAGTVYDAARDGIHVYLVGNFTGAPASSSIASSDKIVRYDTTWSFQFESVHSGTVGQNGTVSPSYMRCIASDGVENLLVGGQFGTVGGIVGNNLAWYKTSTGAWGAVGTVGPAASLPLSVTAIGVNQWVVGGSAMTSVGGVTVANVARKTAAGWDAMGPGLNNKVNDVNHDTSTGRLYAAGQFTDGSTYSAGGLQGLAYYDSSWHSAGLALPTGDVAQTVEVASGKLYVGLNGAGTVQGAARATVTVNSTAPCYPKIRVPFISGQSGTPTVRSVTNETTNQSILLDHTMVANETFTIDCDYQPDPLKGPSSMKKKLYKTIGGVTTDTPGDLQSGSDLAGFMLAPGANVLAVLVTDPSGTAGSVVVQYRNTYDSCDL